MLTAPRCRRSTSLLVLLAAIEPLTGCHPGHTRSVETAATDPDAVPVRYTILVPRCYNDGTPIAESWLTELQCRLFDEFGGYTNAGPVRGAYRMADGTKAEEESLELWIAIPPRRIAALRAALSHLAAELQQESIYLEHGDGTVEFVK